MIPKFPAHGTSKYPPLWNFDLNWTARMDKMISNFPPLWNFKLTWTVHKDKMIPKFPPHGTSKYPPPWNFMELQNTRPHGISN